MMASISQNKKIPQIPKKIAIGTCSCTKQGHRKRMGRLGMWPPSFLPWSVIIKSFFYFTDDANKKVELTQKWSSLLEAGKNEGEIEKELGQPKLDDVTAKRAKKIIKKLNKEAEAAVSSWDITSYLVGIFIFSYHIYVILKAIHGIYLFQD